MHLTSNPPATAPEISINYGGFRQAAVWAYASFRLTSRNKLNLRKQAGGVAFSLVSFLLAKQKKETRRVSKGNGEYLLRG